MITVESLQFMFYHFLLHSPDLLRYNAVYTLKLVHSLSSCHETKKHIYWNTSPFKTVHSHYFCTSLWFTHFLHQNIVFMKESVWRAPLSFTETPQVHRPVSHAWPVCSFSPKEFTVSLMHKLAHPDRATCSCIIMLRWRMLRRTQALEAIQRRVRIGGETTLHVLFHKHTAFQK